MSAPLHIHFSISATHPDDAKTLNYRNRNNESLDPVLYNRVQRTPPFLFFSSSIPISIAVTIPS